VLSKKQFNHFVCTGYNRIPLVCEVLADCETPLSTYLKLAIGPYSYLLESVQGGEQWGRYSIIGLPSKNRLEIKGQQVTIIEEGQPVSKKKCDLPLDEVRKFQQQFIVPPIPALPRFSGGLVGFFGYDTVGHIELHLGKNAVADPIGAPDILLMVSEEIVVFDNFSGRLFVVTHVNPQKSNAWELGRYRLRKLINRLTHGPPPQEVAVTASYSPHTTVNESDIVSSFPKEAFKAAVDKCRKYIIDGDALQIVISQRLSLPYQARPLDLYRALRTLNPSPYMYYLNMNNFHIAGSSPEILVRLEDGRITLRPIAGTRRRGDSEEQDIALENDLLSDPKELAEHLMLIDLGRNDVGRVAQTGSVKLTDKMVIEKYSHVMHIVSNITGQINPNLDAIDVLKATFPAGTLSGAPKVRAMEIIEDLEPDKRGIYSGAVGYICWNGNMDTAIAIRTALIKDKTAYIQVGAGIVADSDPQVEWEETMNKGRAIFKAIEMVNKGLHLPLDEEEV